MKKRAAQTYNVIEKSLKVFSNRISVHAMLFVPEPKADDSSGLHFAGCSSEARARARRASMEIRRMRSETSGGKVDYTLLWKFKKCDPPVLPIPAFCSPRAHGHQVHPLRHPRGEAGGRLSGLGQGRDRPHGVSDDRGCSRSRLSYLHLIPASQPDDDSGLQLGSSGPLPLRGGEAGGDQDQERH